MTPGERIRATRETMGWTQSELADRLGWTKQRVSDLEAGRRPMTLPTLSKLVKVLNLNPREFLD